jgi:hypothetical protein
MCFLVFWFGLEILRLVSAVPEELKKFLEIARKGYQEKRSFALISKRCKTLVYSEREKKLIEKLIF